MNFEEKMMARAIFCAELGAGWTRKNPLVGAIVAKNKKIIGAGFHEKFGENHAEKNAIFNAEKRGFSVEGAEIFVTLEPCAHRGKTESCADFLIKKKIKRVFIGTRDENKIAAGGAEKLRAAGIETKIGLLEKKCRAQNRVFFHGLQKNRPFFFAKMATDENGFVAEKKGFRSKISGKKAQKLTHFLRQIFDGILVGKKTILIDNPRLSTRFFENSKKDFVDFFEYFRIFFGEKHFHFLEFQSFFEEFFTEKIFQNADPTRIFFDRKNKISRAKNLFFDENFWKIPPNFSLEKVAKTLFQKGISSVLIEGGPETISRFFQKNLIDEMLILKSKRVFFEKGVPAFKKFPESFRETRRENLGEDAAIFFQKN